MTQDEASLLEAGALRRICSEPLMWVCAVCGEAYADSEWASHGKSCPLDGGSATLRCTTCREAVDPASGATERSCQSLAVYRRTGKSIFPVSTRSPPAAAKVSSGVPSGAISDDPTDPIILYERGVSLRDSGRMSEAEPLFIEAAGKYRGLYGPFSEQYATVLVALGELYTSQERFDEAENLLIQAAAIRRSPPASAPDLIKLVEERLKAVRSKRVRASGGPRRPRPAATEPRKPLPRPPAEGSSSRTPPPAAPTEMPLPDVPHREPPRSPSTSTRVKKYVANPAYLLVLLVAALPGLLWLFKGPDLPPEADNTTPREFAVRQNVPSERPVLEMTGTDPVPDWQSKKGPEAQIKPETRGASPAAQVPKQVSRTLPSLQDRGARITQPEYPPASRRANEEGTVVLNAYVLATGEVGNVRLERSSGYTALDEAAMDEVKRNWRLIPGRENGEPVAMWHTFAVTFRLSD